MTMQPQTGAKSAEEQPDEIRLEKLRQAARRRGDAEGLRRAEAVIKLVEDYRKMDVVLRARRGLNAR